MPRPDYKSDWQSYAFPEDNMMSADIDIAETFTRIDLSAESFPSGGIPLYVDGSIAYVNSENENTIIFGETGSKKTRSVINPLIATTAGARESAFITDVKGELSANPKLRGYLEKCGINTVYLDFRKFSGDGFNLFEPAFKLYLEGEKDKAAAMVRSLITSLSSRYETSTADPFWQLSAEQYLVPLIEVLFAFCAEKEERRKLINMLTVNAFTNDDGADAVSFAINNKYIEKLAGVNTSLMLRSVVRNPEKTLACIMSTVQSFIQDFTIQKDLLYMLSDTTFNIAEMYEKPTFVFLIVPDETSTYDTISGLLLDMFYGELIKTFNDRYQSRDVKTCRINFICDEFCNLHINDMRSKISASRSRNMRWYLVCQSKKQLDGVYAADAGTIIGNCKNILLLQSSDTDLLDQVSDLCGTTEMTEDGGRRYLVTREMLRSMKKERNFKEALFVRDNVKYFALLPDIDSYEFLRPYEKDGAYIFEKRFASDMTVFEPDDLRVAAKRFVYGEDEDEDEEESEPEDADYDEDDDWYDDEDPSDYDPPEAFVDDDYEDEDDDATDPAPDAPPPAYLDPDCGKLTPDDIAQTSDPDIIPPEAQQTLTRKLSALFASE